MTQLTIDVPESVFAATRTDPNHLKDEVRMTLAAAWYESGRISQEVAAATAGLDRTGFLLALARNGRSSFAVDLDDLDRELSNA
jgi:predicted HTH domain antitoxin